MGPSSNRAADASPGGVTGLRVRDLLLAGILALAFAVALRTWVITAVRISSFSMEGTLLPGDYVLVNMFLFPEMFVPRRGDIVVFRDPRVPNSGPAPILVKRLVGLPGDTVQVRNGVLFVNNRPLHFPSSAGWHRGDHVQDFGPYVLTPDSLLLPQGRGGENATAATQQLYFVVGDNPGRSSDSRSWGAVPHDALLGRVVMVYWSLDPAAWSAAINRRWDYIRWDRIGTFVR